MSPRHICAACKRGFMHLQELCEHRCPKDAKWAEATTQDVSRHLGNDLIDKVPDGYCYLLLTWPEQLGLHQGTAVALTSNLHIRKSVGHLKLVLEHVRKSLDVLL